MAQLQELILTEQPILTEASAVYPYSVDLQKKFTLTSRFGDVYRCFIRKEDKIYLPREIAPTGKIDRRGEGVKIDAKCIIEPRNSEQSRVIKESTDLLLKGRSHIVRAGTGFGKTACALKIAANVGKTTLIVVTKEDLYNQWLKEVHKFWKIPKSEIGQIRQDVCDVAGKKVVVAMLHSLCKEGRYPSHVYRMFGLVIFDEVHRIAADSFMTVCNMVTAKLRLGLSATPNRKDGKDVVIFAHIGPILVKTDMVTLSPLVLRYKTGWKCPRIKKKNPLTGVYEYQKMNHTPGKTMHLSKKLAKDPDRNQMIVTLIKTAYKKDRDIIVFTDLRDHVDLIISLCVRAGIPRQDLTPYISGMKKSEIEKAKSIRVKVATWGMMGEGTDIPWADTCILGMPRSDVEQPVGRILREYPNKKTPVVFDLLDDDSPVFAGYATKRMSFYRKKKSEIKTMA